MSVRVVLQRLLDEVQFQFDIFPRGRNYQPLPWIDLNHTKRGTGTSARWMAIEESLTESTLSSGMDIGCNLGYFCFALAQKGVVMLGVDMDPRHLRIAQYAASKIEIVGVGFCEMTVNNGTVSLLPNVDLVLTLSIWHHWVRSYGLDSATEILSALWLKCGKVMFFETGESEMPADFGLPMTNGLSRKWVEDYLRTNCIGSQVLHLGLFKAFAPLGNENRNVAYRNLFKITRVKANE